MRFTQDTSGKLAAFKTFSSPLWLLRNMGRELLLSIHSNAEIAPPIEGLSSSRNAPEAEWAGLGLRVLGPGEAMRLDLRLEVTPK